MIIEIEILNAIKDKKNKQSDIANLYSQLIPVRNIVNWRKINRAIQDRWIGKSALERVKIMAWRVLEGLE